MALINEIEKQGNFLFKYRGQFPIILFLIAIPFVKFPSPYFDNNLFIFLSNATSIFLKSTKFEINLFILLESFEKENSLVSFGIS